MTNISYNNCFDALFHFFKYKFLQPIDKIGQNFLDKYTCLSEWNRIESSKLQLKIFVRIENNKNLIKYRKIK